ncbi:GlxA family transcriptional regulator [Chromobacterium sp. S0633]|uniref:GlxA family transcriptional regulator n=1 Tax=Chromobacterium sp. S0633 TaxID=2957805 RepID=UPI0020A0706A|nr:GlxA family transcriptional regulator [Chromobacterium sp. S0633]MCP1292490.1 GlxA family transcriptional regulator [Chromobacterium sp. S0633]
MGSAVVDEYHFLLLPEFSFIGFAALMEPFRIANRFQPGASRWRLLSVDGQAVAASNGIALMVDGALAEAGPCTCLFVVSSFHPLRHYTPELGAALRRLERGGMTLGAIDTGCFILAEAGLLRGETVTLHWEAIPAFRERYPQVTASQELFLTERRPTSAGAAAGLDLALALLARRHGRELALAVSEQLVQGQMRSPSEHQRLQVASRYQVHNKKLAQAIRLMEEQLEEPWPPEELAARCGATRRQLERLFRAHLKASPAEFYRALRLDRARWLLRQTELSVVEISVVCGFESPSYFSRAYRKRFDRSPREDREDRSGA